MLEFEEQVAALEAGDTANLNALYRTAAQEDVGGPDLCITAKRKGGRWETVNAAAPTDQSKQPDAPKNKRRNNEAGC